MKKILTVIIVSFVLCFTSIVTIAASPATSRTRTLNANFDIVWTQDAFLPRRTVTNLNLRSPQDAVFNEQDHVFIADRDNARIVVYDTVYDKVLQIITHPSMRAPSGIALSDEGDIYVADPIAEIVLRFSKDGNLIETFTRPTSLAFGDTTFKPHKISVDNRRNMYIISEGVYNGVIQLSNAGEFLGYFTSNRVRLTVAQILQDIFFTQAQRDLLARRVPTTFTNVFIDNRGAVYTTTMGTYIHAVKKHNTAGENLFDNQFVFGPNDLIDVVTDDRGIVYAVSKSGLIYVYSSDGYFIFTFGSSYANQDIAGLFSSISAVEVDSQGQLWVLDGEKSFLQSFRPTEYATQIFSAIDYFNQGRFEEASTLWRSVLRLNQMSSLAHNGMGMSYMFTEQYEDAMFHFSIAGNRYQYSQAFWEVRNQWLQSNLANILLGLIVFFMVMAITKKWRHKTQWLRIVKDTVKSIANIKIISDVLFVFAFIRHPIDSFYDLKIGKRGSVTGALIIYSVFFMIYIWYLLGKGFIFQAITIEDVDMQSVVLGFFSIIFLTVLCNYLVSSINDGDGSFKQILKLGAYSLAPIMVLYLGVIGLSYVLTFNEIFIVQIMEQGAIVWTGLNLYLGVQEVHDYTFKEALRSIALTIVFMLVIALILLIIIIMGEQVFMFFEAIIREVIRNVVS